MSEEHKTTVSARSRHKPRRIPCFHCQSKLSIPLFIDVLRPFLAGLYHKKRHLSCAGQRPAGAGARRAENAAEEKRRLTSFSGCIPKPQALKSRAPPAARTYVAPFGLTGNVFPQNIVWLFANAAMDIRLCYNEKGIFWTCHRKPRARKRPPACTRSAACLCERRGRDSGDGKNESVIAGDMPPRAIFIFALFEVHIGMEDEP